MGIDGTKVRAHASRHKAMSYRRLMAEEKYLKEEINCLPAKAEDAGHGEEDSR